MDGSDKYTSTAEHKECTDILLIGKTGNGKSATGNSILGRKEFVTRASPTSVTKKAQMGYSDLGDRIVKVVDIPGIYDTDLTTAHALEMVISAAQYAVAANPRGYHVILLVVPIGRFTKEDYNAVQQLKSIFGLHFVEKFTIIVMTRGDTFDPEENSVRNFEEWCQTLTGELKKMQNECRNRLILFDNRTKDEDKLHDQRRRLLTMIDNLSQYGDRYSDEHFQMAKVERDRILIEAKLPVIREESLMEANLIIEQLKKIQLVEPEQQLDRLKMVRQRAVCLVKSIAVQDQGFGILKEVIGNANNISFEIDEQIKTIQLSIETRAKKMQSPPNLERSERQQQIQNKFARQETETEDMDAVYATVVQQIRESNERAEKEYHRMVEIQEENLQPKLKQSFSEKLSKAVRSIFRM